MTHSTHTTTHAPSPGFPSLSPGRSPGNGGTNRNRHAPGPSPSRVVVCPEPLGPSLTVRSGGHSPQPVSCHTHERASTGNGSHPKEVDGCALAHAKKVEARAPGFPIAVGKKIPPSSQGHHAPGSSAPACPMRVDDRLCMGCWRWKSRRHFRRDRRTASGLDTHCKSCRSLEDLAAKLRREERDRQRRAGGQLAFVIERL